jgi:16S rRNA G966 N2-methylase RsmD
MTRSAHTQPRPPYNRELLLAGNKRNAILELSEVQRYGSDSYADPDYVSLYGMRPAQWYAKGVRVLGRTAVECTRDELANSIADDVASAVGAMAPAHAVLLLDLFAGSANTLCWLQRRVPRARSLGFELDPRVFALTRRNLAALELPIEILNTDFQSGVAGVSVPTDELVVVFIAPPWGDALVEASGLDLRRTMPPVREIVDFLRDSFPQNRLLCAVQIYESVEPDSLAELETRFEHTTRRIYELNVPRRNHGILLGATKVDQRSSAPRAGNADDPFRA